MYKFLVLAFLLLTGAAAQAQTAPPTATPETPEQLVQRQLEAYNARNAATFAATYAENVELFNFPNKPRLSGRANLLAYYTKVFAAVPQGHCDIVKRIVLGNKVIDHERVSGLPNGKVLEAVAIYEVEDGLIRRVTFVQ